MISEHINNKQYSKVEERSFCIGCTSYREGQMCAMQTKCNRVYILGYKDGVIDCTNKFEEAEEKERDQI